jgi:hypothetical protein
LRGPVRLNGLGHLDSRTFPKCRNTSLLESTLIDMPTGVDSKWVTEILNSLDATLTKNRGEGGRGRLPTRVTKFHVRGPEA